MASKTLLDELELPLAQCIDVEDGQTLVRHAVPGLDGDFVQRTARRAARVAVTGVVAGTDSRDGLEKLRDKLRGTEPVDFVADIATATRVTRVLVEALDVREVAGKPERFEYAFLLREYNPPPPGVTEVPPGDPPPVETDTGNLGVEVIVEGEPDFDMGRVSVTAEGPASAPTSRVLTTRTNNRWTEEKLPPGSYTVRAAVADPPMAAAGQGEVKAGQTATVTLRLVRAPGLARAFVVTFRFDSAFVEPCMRAVLRRAAAYAAAHPSEHLVVVGHTDKTGSDAYNQSLSERRARAVFASIDFGNEAARAVGEWTTIRQKRVGSGVPSVQDSWATREYQQMLQELGFYPGRIDGKHTPATGEAVRAFRCRKGLPPGTTMDDAVWEALIRDYLADRAPTVARDRLLANCADSKLEWIGCGEQDPVKNTEAAHRPNRRVELLFVTDAALPCTVPVPDTWALPAPAPGQAQARWCLGPGDKAKRACFVSRLEPAPPRWSVEPADGAVITAQGTITKEVERADGTVETVAAGGTRFVLVASDGEFKASELGSGEPAPATAAADGSFSFPGKRAGVYVLEVQDTILARLAAADAPPATGPTVCKALLTAADRLDVVLLRDPVLREIRLPVIVHPMRALNPASREVRICPASLDPSVTHEQRTARDEAAARALFDAANRIWGQARVRWEVRDVVPESFATAGRDACHVSEDERNGIFADAATPNVLNLFLFGSMEVRGEAGVHVVGKLVDGADATIRTFEAVAMGDRILLKLFANADPVEKTPDGPESEVILAHELGHYLSLDHVTGSGAATQRRLMLPSEAPDHRRLDADEVRRARASDNARDCGRISVEVTGATRFGGSIGHRFVAIRDAAAAPVTVDARVPPAQLNAAGSTFVMTGGDAGTAPTQRTVSRAALGRREVIARWTAAGGAQQSETYAAVHVVDFDVAVDGARALGNGRFLAIRSATGGAVVRAVVFPEPVSIPRDLTTWTGGEETPDPLRRRVPLAAAGETRVSVTVAGVTKTVTVVVSELSLKVRGAEETSPDQFAAAQDPAGQVEVEATFTPPLPDDPPDLVQWTGGQPGPAPRIRIVSKQAVAITPVLAQVGGAQKQATVNVVSFTLDVAGAERPDPAGTDFFVVAPAGQAVTVTATVTPLPSPLPPNFVRMQGGQAVPGNPLQRTVPAGAAGAPVTVRATVAGTTRAVTIHVVTFTLDVQPPALALGAGGTGPFLVLVDPASPATMVAAVSPSPSPVPAGLVTWATPATVVPGNPLRATVPRAAGGVVSVNATLAGVTRTLALHVATLELAVADATPLPAGGTDFFALRDPAAGAAVTVDAVFTPPLPSPLPAGAARWNVPAVSGNPLQVKVSRNTAARTQVRLQVPALTASRQVNVSVLGVSLSVGAPSVAIGAVGSGNFLALAEAGQSLTVTASLTPPVTPLPAGLLAWSGATPSATNPLQATFSRATSGPPATVAATVLGTAHSVIIHVSDFTLTATDATPLPAGGTEFFALHDTAATVTVQATFAPDPGLALPPTLVDWTGSGGTAVAGNPLGRSIPRAATVRTPLRARIAVLGVTRTGSVTVLAVAMDVRGAVQIGTRASTVFAAQQGAGDVTLVLTPTPALTPPPAGLVAWSGATAGADPLRATVPRGAAARTTATASVLGTAFTRTIAVLADPSVAGPLLVDGFDYEVTTGVPFTVATATGGTRLVRRKGLVRFPGNGAGGVSASQPAYPLVLILHGNHDRFTPPPASAPVDSFRGFDYLARHLASHGYIAVSIDADDISMNRPVNITERGRLVLANLAIIAARNTAAGDVLAGHVDLGRIGLIGHSRGGEGVLAAAQQNTAGGSPNAIGAVVAIAPSNFTGIRHSSVPFMLLYGSADGDVFGGPVPVAGLEEAGTPWLLYDRATTPKAMVYVHGAIHNLFCPAPDWLRVLDSVDPGMIGPTAHLDVARGYCLAFMERHLRGDEPFDLFVTHAEKPASLTAVELHQQFQGTTRLVVDDFEQPGATLAARAATNTLLQAVTASGLVQPTPAGLTAPLTEVALTRITSPSLVDDGFGAMLAWNAVGGSYRTSLGSRDISAFQVLSFRVAQFAPSARNSPGVALDFVVKLVDAAGQAAELPLSTVSTVPAPYSRADAVPNKSSLKTIRLRLDAFKAANPRLDLTRLSSIRFEFRATARGEVAVDDIEFSL